MTTYGRGALCAASMGLFAALTPASARADTDACTLLTPAQVAAAIGEPVRDGQHVSPNFVKTCTWTPSGKSKVSAVTLSLQTATSYDGGKKQLAFAIAASGEKGTTMKPASVGEDAYYFITGDQAGLMVKKGGASFKVAVYAKIPVAEKEAMEMKLATEVLGKL